MTNKADIEDIRKQLQALIAAVDTLLDKSSPDDSEVFIDVDFKLEFSIEGPLYSGESEVQEISNLKIKNTSITVNGTMQISLDNFEYHIDKRGIVVVDSFIHYDLIERFKEKNSWVPKNAICEDWLFSIPDGRCSTGRQVISMY